MSDGQSYWIKQSGKAKGPFSKKQLKEQMNAGRATRDSLVSLSKHGPWSLLGDGLPKAKRSKAIRGRRRSPRKPTMASDYDDAGRRTSTGRDPVLPDVLELDEETNSPSDAKSAEIVDLELKLIGGSDRRPVAEFHCPHCQSVLTASRADIAKQCDSCSWCGGRFAFSGYLRAVALGLHIAAYEMRKGSGVSRDSIWWINHDKGTRQVTAEELRKMYLSGEITKESLIGSSSRGPWVQYEIMSDWLRQHVKNIRDVHWQGYTDCQRQEEEQLSSRQLEREAEWDKEAAERRVSRLQSSRDGFVLFCAVTAGILFLATVIPWGGGASAPSSPDDSEVKYVGRQRLESSLKDPDSLQIINEEVIRKLDGTIGYRAQYRAKNSLGGYVVDEFYAEWSR